MLVFQRKKKRYSLASEMMGYLNTRVIYGKIILIEIHVYDSSREVTVSLWF